MVAPVCRWWRLVNYRDKDSSKELVLNEHSGLRMGECGALPSAPSEPLRLSPLWHPAFLRPLPTHTPSVMPELRAGLTCPRGGRGQCHTRCMTWPGALGVQGRAHFCVCQVRGELPGVGGRPLPRLANPAGCGVPILCLLSRYFPAYSTWSLEFGSGGHSTQPAPQSSGQVPILQALGPVPPFSHHSGHSEHSLRYTGPLSFPSSLD